MNLPAMMRLIKPLLKHDGYSDTALSGVNVFCSHKPLARTPMVYQPSLIFVAQGRKIGYLGDREIHYNPGHYLVQTLHLPFECETFASEQAPLMGVSVHIDPAMLAELVHAMRYLADVNRPPEPMASVPMTEAMEEAVTRLLRALAEPQTTQLMGPGRVREVVFEALNGAQGPALRALVDGSGNYSRVVQALELIHSDIAAGLTVEQLAEQAHMSVSSFHQHFKEVTQSSPLQYIKRMRLLKAQMLLSRDDLNVTQTAEQVGYHSVNQFSRDYKRYFCVSPLQDKRASQPRIAG
ncbi:AraC family transcriptional regulator [Gilvimarinus agarilyticus]|uniref:AraC family transcriptional regulator n=1 Tax=Gilvimarinus agarilyticus TaxID=679259 RepID=UPI0005A15030|nr:AraC family transcriptional regulator [Gilvimarinus agarilyticus]